MDDVIRFTPAHFENVLGGFGGYGTQTANEDDVLGFELREQDGKEVTEGVLASSFLNNDLQRATSTLISSYARYILLFSIFFYYRWIARSNGPVRNIFGHNRTRANNDTSTDMDSRHNHHTATNPNIITNGYFPRFLKSLFTHGDICPIKGVITREYYAFRAHHHIISQCYWS